jgi:hypothetical protein
VKGSYSAAPAGAVAGALAAVVVLAGTFSGRRLVRLVKRYGERQWAAGYEARDADADAAASSKLAGEPGELRVLPGGAR